MVCRFYLSDSYFAAGRYAEAKSVLGELPARFYADAPVAGVWYADLARAELALGENADEAMEGLRGIIALSGGKAALLEKSSGELVPFGSPPGRCRRTAC